MAAAELPEVAVVALCMAVGCAEALKPLLGFLQDGAGPRSPVLDAALAAAVLAVPTAYLLGVTLLYLHVAPARTPAPAACCRWSAALACTALLLFLVVAFIFVLAAGGGR